jgi:hypothetical protein
MFHLMAFCRPLSPFGGKTLPPTLTKGKRSSANVVKLATALALPNRIVRVVQEVANIPRRVPEGLQRHHANSCTMNLQNSKFLPTDSTKSDALRANVFNGIPENLHLSDINQSWAELTHTFRQVGNQGSFVRIPSTSRTASD